MPKCPFAKAICFVLLFLFFSGCTPRSGPFNKIDFKQIPEPSFSAKLRVLVLPVTASQHKSHWAIPDQEFSRVSCSIAGGILQQKGIYEVVPPADLARALGDQKIAGPQWTANNYSLVREAAKALRADYVFIVERGAAGLPYWKMALINKKTGKQYATSSYAPRQQDSGAIRKEYQKDIKEAYREIFLQAKGDLFETAVRKGKLAQRVENGTYGIKKVQRQPDAPAQDKSVDIAKKSNERQSWKTRLVVYDFEAVRYMEVASLILSDALREELHKNGRFILISREDLNHIKEEIRLQKSGLSDEKRAVQLGSWLAANEIVTGKLALQGSTYVLSVKRTDMNTMAELGMGSLKCRIGKEENLLAGIPEIARKVAGRP